MVIIAGTTVGLDTSFLIESHYNSNLATFDLKIFLPYICENWCSIKTCYLSSYSINFAHVSSVFSWKLFFFLDLCWLVFCHLDTRVIRKKGTSVEILNYSIIFACRQVSGAFSWLLEVGWPTPLLAVPSLCRWSVVWERFNIFVLFFKLSTWVKS